MEISSELPRLVCLLLITVSLSCLVEQTQAVPKIASGEMDKILNKGGLEGFLKATKKSAILLEFYSEMCGSCKAFTPKLEALHKKIVSDKEDLPVYKVNIDDNVGMQLATQQNALEDGIPNFRAYFLDADEKLKHEDLISNEQRMDDSYDSPTQMLEKVHKILGQKRNNKTDL